MNECSRIGNKEEESALDPPDHEFAGAMFALANCLWRSLKDVEAKVVRGNGAASYLR
jgi:hypothetical protein